MQRIRVAVAALVLAFAARSAAAQQPSFPTGPARIAYINSQVILANTPGRAEAESAFAREMAGARAEVQRMQADLDSAVATYNRTSVAMSPTARQQREADLRAQQQHVQDRASELDSTMQERESELSGPIMQRVRAVIEGIRAEMNISMIFDASAQGGALIAADRTLDLTPLVIQRLQAGGPTPMPPTDTTTPPAAAPPAAAPPSTTPAPADTTRRPAQPLRGRRP